MSSFRNFFSIGLLQFGQLTLSNNIISNHPGGYFEHATIAYCLSKALSSLPFYYAPYFYSDIFEFDNIEPKVISGSFKKEDCRAGTRSRTQVFESMV